MEKFNAAISIESMNIPTTKRVMEEPAKVTDLLNDRVQIVEIENYKKAAECLAEAFLIDDVARYFIYTDDHGFNGWTSEKRELHDKVFQYITYAHCLKGLVTTIGPDYDSVALWMPPGKNMDDYYTMFRSGMWRLRYKLTTEGGTRFFQEFLPKLHEAKNKALGKDDDNSWYLVYIGTKPGSQKKGYAKALIEMVTKHADAEGLKCYLESSHPDNFKFYKRRGFQASAVIPKLYLQRAKYQEPIPLDIMVREPDTSKLERQTANSRTAVNGTHGSSP